MFSYLSGWRGHGKGDGQIKKVGCGVWVRGRGDWLEGGMTKDRDRKNRENVLKIPCFTKSLEIL